MNAKLLLYIVSFFFIDCFSIVAQDNLINNGEFEAVTSDNFPQDWDVSVSNGDAKMVKVEPSGINGSNALKMGLAGTVTHCSVSQTVAVEKGKRYKFGGYICYSNTTKVLSQVTIEDLTGKILYVYEIEEGQTSSQNVPENDKVYREFSFTAEMDQIVLRISTNGISRVLRMDNLSLVVDDTPINDGKTQPFYYIDPESGNNENSGLTPEEPLKDLTGKFLENAEPGCQVLFKAGTTYKGIVHFKDVKGTAEKPVVISTYWGDDTSADFATLDGAGQMAAIRLSDCSFFKIEKLAITADGGGFKNNEGKHNMRCGVLVETTVPETRSESIHLSELNIHDVFYHDPGYDRPNDTGTANGSGGYGYGIRFMNTAAGALMTDVSVHNSSIERISHTGLKFTGAVGDNAWITDADVSELDIVYSGGPGMQMGSVKDARIHHCSVDMSGSDNDSRNWKRGSGMWTWNCDNVVVEHNRFTNASGPADSFGSHIDFNCSNVVFQYNFYANNIGGFVEILGNSRNCSYRYNVSVNDGTRTKGQPGRTIWFSGYCGSSKRKGPYNTYVYNNTIYTSPEMVSRYAIERTSQGVLLANNIFHVMGDAKSVSTNAQPAKSDGDDVFFENNLFLQDNFPEVQMGGDKAPLFGDAQFVNPGGLQIEDYRPLNKELVYGKGVSISNLPGDENGLLVGLEVEKDILGNDLGGRIDMGAIAYIEDAGVEENLNESVRVLVDGHTLTVMAGEVTSILVYNVNGRCERIQNNVSETSFTLSPGVYVVRVGNVVRKVIIL